eukprot:CAMPEP_0168735460 /NCGR_PEP_ID=MMETSP0724-20121128/9344_1 /TAXON_ID=265536 /ORGANISM="Amphiprora sp., Strain CCMP467" /LENGTH=291 /DNA_ID=CAMNT_0008782603 /DNA_START=30 /DNA_END=905 /DNA_ORIENTATION=+
MIKSPTRSKAKSFVKGKIRTSKKDEPLATPDTAETETTDHSQTSLSPMPYNKRLQRIGTTDDDDLTERSDLTESHDQGGASVYLPRTLSNGVEGSPKGKTSRRRQSLLGMMGTQTDGKGSTKRFSELGSSNASLGFDSSNHDDDDASVAGVGEPDFEIVMTVVNSWEVVKSIDGYEEAIAEQILLRMMELDCNVRKDLDLMSIRSSRFDVVKEKVMSVLDGLVSFLGPDLEDFFDEIEEVGRRYRADGFKDYLLTQSVTDAVRFVLPEEEFPPAIERGWLTVLNFLVFKMH